MFMRRLKCAAPLAVNQYNSPMRARRERSALAARFAVNACKDYSDIDGIGKNITSDRSSRAPQARRPT
jgi:hypothetical protein